LKKFIWALVLLLFAFGLASCSSPKQGKITSVAVSFSLNDMMDGTIDNPVYGKTVTVETDDGKNIQPYGMHRHWANL
jgi:hypothetical protein